MCSLFTRARRKAAASASSTRVFTPSTSSGIRSLEHADLSPAFDEQPHGVRQVELALRVRRLDPFEHRPQLVSCEDVDRGVDLSNRALRVVGVGVLDDPPRGGRRRRGRSARRRAGRAARTRARWPSRREPVLCRRSAASSSGADARMVAGDDEQLSARRRRCSRAARSESPVPSGCSCTATSTPSNASAASGDRTTTSGSAPTRPHRLDDPVDEPPPEQRVQMLRRRGLHPRAETGGHHDGCEVAGHQSWGARIRTWDRGTKTRCLTTWLRPTEIRTSLSRSRVGSEKR